MITYQLFASALSVVIVVMYATLVGIAIRRSHFRSRRVPLATQEAIASHARFLEGPVWTVLLLLALGTMVAAAVIGTPEYGRVAALLVASLRGALFCLGMWALAWYWRQRATWR